MKKIISMLLCLVMLCTSLLLVACGEKDPEALVNDSVVKMNELDSYSAKMTTEIEMSMGGVTVEVPIIMDMKAEGLGTDDAKVYVKYNITMMGETQVMEIYMDNEYVYLSADGEKMKMSIESLGDEADQYKFDEGVQELLQTLPADVLKDVEVVKDEDGNSVVEVNVDPAMFEQIYDKALDSMGEDYGELIGSIDVKNPKVKVVVNKKGYIVDYVMSFTMDMGVAGQDTSSEVVMKVEFDNPGKSVTVTPMEGYENYELVG